MECICYVCTKLLQLCPTLTPWTVAHQAPLSMAFSRQEYWSGLPCPPRPLGREDLSCLLHWQADSLPPVSPAISVFGKIGVGRIRIHFCICLCMKVNMNLGKLRETARGKEAWRAAVHRVSKSWTWPGDWTTTCMKIFWGTNPKK